MGLVNVAFSEAIFPRQFVGLQAIFTVYRVANVFALQYVIIAAVFRLCFQSKPGQEVN
jgi:hypothetical protein